MDDCMIVIKKDVTRKSRLDSASIAKPHALTFETVMIGVVANAIVTNARRAKGSAGTLSATVRTATRRHAESVRASAMYHKTMVLWCQRCEAWAAHILNGAGYHCAECQKENLTW